MTDHGPWLCCIDNSNSKRSAIIHFILCRLWVETPNLASTAWPEISWPKSHYHGEIQFSRCKVNRHLIDDTGRFNQDKSLIIKVTSLIGGSVGTDYTHYIYIYMLYIRIMQIECIYWIFIHVLITLVNTIPQPYAETVKQYHILLNLTVFDFGYFQIACYAIIWLLRSLFSTYPSDSRAK